MVLTIVRLAFFCENARSVVKAWAPYPRSVCCSVVVSETARDRLPRYDVRANKAQDQPQEDDSPTGRVRPEQPVSTSPWNPPADECRVGLAVPPEASTVPGDIEAILLARQQRPKYRAAEGVPPLCPPCASRHEPEQSWTLEPPPITGVRGVPLLWSPTPASDRQSRPADPRGGTSMQR